MTLLDAGVNDRLTTGKRNKYPRFPHGFVTKPRGFRDILQRTGSVASLKVNSQNDLNRRVLSVRLRAILMSDLKDREDRERLPPRRSQNKDARVNRPHIICTNHGLSMHYGLVFTQKFGRGANFLAMGCPVILEHNVNI